jgi:hypothetical protein
MMSWVSWDGMHGGVVGAEDASICVEFKDRYISIGPFNEKGIK